MSDPNPSSAPSFGQQRAYPLPASQQQEPVPYQQRGMTVQHPQQSGSSSTVRSVGKPAKRILGIQPALFVGMCLLAVVTVVTVVLIFTGDFESQSARVTWTVLVFLAFTGLLAFDLRLARRDSTPLVLGVVGNTYLLAVLMLSIWMKSSDEWSFDGWLFGVVVLTLLVVRAAVAGAWGLLVAGRRSGTVFGRWTGLVAAGLLGWAAVLLTFHFVLDAFNSEPTEFYWRATVAVIVVAALASSVTVLLFWNRRNLDWEEAEAAGLHVPVARPVPADAPAPGVHGNVQQGVAQTGHPHQQQVQGGPVPSQGGLAPAVPQAPVGVSGLLPWPTFPDGSPYPAGADGQPVFPPRG